VSYRRLDAPGLDSLLGAGVFYGATASEGGAFSGDHAFIAGGANSAGQSAVNLARYAQQVTIVVRGDSLAARMSQYLIDEITATANIDVRTSTKIAAQRALQARNLDLKDTSTGGTETVPASALVLISAMPHTDWPRSRSARTSAVVVTEAASPTAETRRPVGRCRARRSRWRPACPAYSPLATSATARSNGSRPRSARARSPPPR
jgi:thioredoxin reductase (NADPH)